MFAKRHNALERMQRQFANLAGGVAVPGMETGKKFNWGLDESIDEGNKMDNFEDEEDAEAARVAD